jgi:anti-anti-sigma factor
MSEGNVYYALSNGTCVMRFQGAISYTLAAGLNRFLDDLFDRGEFKDILVDLSDTESIDSTGLGLLARIANFVRQRDGRRPLLFSSQPDINAVLRSICLDDAFVLCAELPEVGAGQALPAVDASQSELARIVLEAHRLLCDMNQANRDQFQNVVDAFERKLGKVL